MTSSCLRKPNKGTDKSTRKPTLCEQGRMLPPSQFSPSWTIDSRHTRGSPAELSSGTLFPNRHRAKFCAECSKMSTKPETRICRTKNRFGRLVRRHFTYAESFSTSVEYFSRSFYCTGADHMAIKNLLFHCRPSHLKEQEDYFNNSHVPLKSA